MRPPPLTTVTMNHAACGRCAYVILRTGLLPQHPQPAPTTTHLGWRTRPDRPLGGRHRHNLINSRTTTFSRLFVRSLLFLFFHPSPTPCLSSSGCCRAHCECSLRLAVLLLSSRLTLALATRSPTTTVSEAVPNPVQRASRPPLHLTISRCE